MECYVCNQEADQQAPTGDSVTLACRDCGHYRVTGSVIALLDRGRWLHTLGMRQWLDEQHSNGVQVPTISTSVVIWDGVWVKG